MFNRSDQVIVRDGAESFRGIVLNVNFNEVGKLIYLIQFMGGITEWYPAKSLTLDR